MELYYAVKLIFAALLLQSQAGANVPRVKRADLCTRTPDSCQNGGKCTLNIDLLAYACNCAAGWSGRTCTTPSGPCVGNQCANGATCVNNDAVQLGDLPYTCTCPAGFTGFYCDAHIITGCTSAPCQHGGTCTNNPLGGFQCSCPYGWLGTTCNSLDYCAFNECQNRATCVISGSGYACTCLQGFQGARCESFSTSCTATTCLNGGTCYPSGSAGFTCSCARGFTGMECQLDINECSPNPCQNGGGCTQVIPPPSSGPLYRCVCLAGWTGSSCESGIDGCTSTPCRNGGFCVGFGGSQYYCLCQPGFMGTLCETASCTANPCVRGSCISSGSGYSCSCPSGYTGSRCESTSDVCASNPCRNGAACQQLNPAGSAVLYVCTCAFGWRGADCSIEIMACASAPCLNGGACSRAGPGTYQCQCISNYAGLNCQTFSACASSSCMNGASCVPILNGTNYICICTPSFTGPLCSSPVCPSLLSAEFSILCPSKTAPDFRGVTSSTLNQTCTRASDFLICTKTATAGCSSEVAQSVWGVVQNSFINCCLKTGPTADCPLPVSSCAQHPCMMNGICTDTSSGGFRCSCIGGLIGDRCQTDIDECSSSPCVATATCQNLLNSYRCLCPPGICGSRCEIRSYSCITVELVADPCNCDYFLSCLGAGLQPTRTRCGKILNFQLLFDSVSRTCALPSSFQGYSTMYKLVQGCRQP